MENKLYPLKFEPQLKYRVWGGEKLNSYLKKDTKGETKIGESWEISDVEDSISVVSNGFLKDNSLDELIEIYMGDLVGEKVFEKFGHSFPLLIKFIDAKEALSIQVHPDDKLAKERHNSFGKTEMWYVVDAEPNAYLINGFSQQINPAQYVEHIKNNTIESVLKNHNVKEGDVFFIPAGRVHAIGAGILIAEIQQTSDVTYRIYDFNRIDKDGAPRQLHTEESVDSIDYKMYENFKTEYKTEEDKPVEIVNCQYFTTSVIDVKNKVIRDYYALDSFVILISVKGNAKIKYDGGEETIKMGETVLIPADLRQIEILASEESKILEVYVP